MLLFLTKISFFLFLFCIPISTRILVHDQNSYDLGFFNEFSSFYVFLPEILLIISLFFLGLTFLKNPKLIPKKNLLFESFLLFSILSLPALIFAKDKMLAFLWIFRFLELSSLCLFFSPRIMPKKKFWLILGVSISVQVFIGLLQFILGRSLGLDLLGEFQFFYGQKGVAVLDFSFGKIPRAYGTFSHPNALGAICVLFFLVFFHVQKSKNMRALRRFLPIFLLGVFISFSRSAALALFIPSLLLLFYERKNKKKKILFIALCVALTVFIVRYFESGFSLDNESFSERVNLIQPYTETYLGYPLGIGGGNSTLFLGEKEALNFWQINPIHNIFLLALVEFGMLSFLVFISIFNKLILFSKRNPSVRIAILSIAITGFFDHFWLTCFSASVFMYLVMYRFSK